MTQLIWYLHWFLDSLGKTLLTHGIDFFVVAAAAVEMLIPHKLFSYLESSLWPKNNFNTCMQKVTTVAHLFSKMQIKITYNQSFWKITSYHRYTILKTVKQEMSQKQYALDDNPSKFKATVSIKSLAVLQKGESKDNNPILLTQMQ